MAVPFRDDAGAARERIDELERESVRWRAELDLARRRNGELAALRERLSSVSIERDWLASDASWSPRVRRFVIATLVSSWFGLVAATAIAHTFRMRANAAIEREARTSERLAETSELLDATHHDVVPTTPTALEPTAFATVMRAHRSRRWLDVLEIRASRTEPPVLAEVVAITAFDMP